MAVEDSVTRRFEVRPGRFLTFRHQYDGRGKIIDFAITITLQDGREIARMDTCHGELHTHYYGLDGEQDAKRIVREILPSDPLARADQLHGVYGSCYQDMIEVAEGRAP